MNEIKKYLRENLGDKLVLYLLNLDKNSIINLNECDYNNELAKKLENIYYIISPIIKKYDSRTVISWLFGRNTNLEEESPAFVLRHSKDNLDISNLISASKLFVQ